MFTSTYWNECEAPSYVYTTTWSTILTRSARDATFPKDHPQKIVERQKLIPFASGSRQSWLPLWFPFLSLPTALYMMHVPQSTMASTWLSTSDSRHPQICSRLCRWQWWRRQQSNRLRLLPSPLRRRPKFLINAPYIPTQRPHNRKNRRQPHEKVSRTRPSRKYSPHGSSKGNGKYSQPRRIKSGPWLCGRKKSRIPRWHQKTWEGTKN